LYEDDRQLDYLLALNNPRLRSALCTHSENYYTDEEDLQAYQRET